MSAPLKLNIERAGAEFGELVELSSRLGFDLSGVLDGLLDSATPVFGVDVDPGVAPATDDGVFTYKLADRLYGVLAALRAWDRKRDFCQINVRQDDPPSEIAFAVADAGAKVICNFFDSARDDFMRDLAKDVFLTMLRARCP